LSDETVLNDWAAYTRTGSVSSEIGTDSHEVMVIGQDVSGDRYRLAHGVLEDVLDAATVRRILTDAGLDDTYRLGALVAKCEPDPRGSVRGWRHTMLTDADIGSFRHARGT